MAEKIIITCGSGFIGTHLVEELYKKGYETFILDTKETKTKEANFLYGDIRDAQHMKECITKIQPSAIIHLAGMVNGKSKDLYEINVEGTKNILNAFSGKVIFMSTGMVYQGNEPPYHEEMPIHPIDEYPKTKRMAEELCMERENVSIIRASVVYGKGQKEEMFLPQLRDAVLVKKQPFRMTKGEQKRDFIHVKDLVKAIGILLKTNAPGVFNISSAKQIAIQEVIEKAKKILGEFPIEQSMSYRPNEMWGYTLSNEKAKKNLQWNPEISFEEGLKEILEG